MKSSAYTFLTIEEATAPKAAGLFEHVTDSWWVTHPDHGLAFFSRINGPLHPQCNRDERLTRHLAATIRYGWEPEVIYLESAWVPVNRKDL